MNTEEVEKIIKMTNNLKHRTLFSVIYSCGMRVSEAVTLELQDIDYKAKKVHIRNAKGKKDRYVILANTTAEIIQQYIAEYKPKHWLFEGASGGWYSIRSI